MGDCLFCKIVKGEIPSYKVYEDDYVLAFLDAFPVSAGHVLVIPKKHFANYEEIDEENLFKIYRVVKKIGKALKSGLGVSGYNTTVNNGAVSGQVIPHLHIHLIPRRKGDGLKLWPQGKYEKGEEEIVLKKIKNNLI